MIAKIHKIHERRDQPDRLNDKDAHDIYRLLLATTDTAALGSSFQRLLTDPISKTVTEQALDRLRPLFADGPDALGSVMAGRAEEGIGDPDLVAASVAALAADVLAAVADAPG